MKLNSFICLTYHLSDNLEIRHTFSPTTYTNEKFWFHTFLVPLRSLNKIMCFVLVNSTQIFQKGFYSILLVMHEKLIGRRCCFYIDGIQKCTIVFKLKIFKFRALDIKCSFVCLNFVLFRIIQIACFCGVFCLFRFIQFVLLYNKKTKDLLMVYRRK